ncbi:MAG: hypothetical protein HZA78_08905 [Candidatus Schekmanbacteria bacterium]|nr:hypothetical protein [Candidatus Schekmanbacteria bacterium]
MPAISIKTKAKKVIDSLSEERVKAVLDLMEYLEEKEGWEATFDLMKDKRLLADYKEAKKDLAEGRLENFVPWEKVKRNV